jgi:hypothetical protein
MAGRSDSRLHWRLGNRLGRFQNNHTSTSRKDTLVIIKQKYTRARVEL